MTEEFITRTKSKYNKVKNYEVCMVVECKVFKKIKAANKAEAKQIAINRQLRSTRRLAAAGYIIGDVDVFDAVES
jgi:hypothetical protein